MRLDYYIVCFIHLLLNNNNHSVGATMGNTLDLTWWWCSCGAVFRRHVNAVIACSWWLFQQSDFVYPFLIFYPYSFINTDSVLQRVSRGTVESNIVWNWRHKTKIHFYPPLFWLLHQESCSLSTPSPRWPILFVSTIFVNYKWNKSINTSWRKIFTLFLTIVLVNSLTIDFYT